MKQLNSLAYAVLLILSAGFVLVAIRSLLYGTPLVLNPTFGTVKSGSHIVQQNFQHTFFGYPDNCDWTGCYTNLTAYECSNPDGSNRDYTATGDGSFARPLTVAFQPGGKLQKCGLVYLPYLEKYGILDGLCASCEIDHIDIWVGGTCKDDFSNICACEDWLTPKVYQPVVHGAIHEEIMGKTIDLRPLYDSTSQSCCADCRKKSDPPRDAITTPKLQTRMTGACNENMCECPSC